MTKALSPIHVKHIDEKYRWGVYDEIDENRLFMANID